MEFTMQDHGYEVELDFRNLMISSDETKGVRPYVLLVSSVAGCSGMVLRKMLNKMRISFDDIAMSADVKRNPEEADRVEEIKLHFVITGKEISEKKMKRAMELTHKNCSMIQSVKDSIRIVETYEIQP